MVTRFSFAGVGLLAFAFLSAGSSLRAADYYGGDSKGGPGEGMTESVGETFDDYDFDEVGGAFLGDTLSVSDSHVGYIDSAVVGTQVRFRFDAAFDFDEPDRAEYFYSTWTTFGGRTDPNVFAPNDSINAQTFSLYYEQLITCRLSLFVQGGFVFNDPSGMAGAVNVLGPNESGFGDMIAGLKYNVWQGCNNQITFQLKNYIPTGEEDKWLTAGHYSIEPAILYYHRLSDRWTVESEVRDWIAIGGANDGSPYAGNVLRWGIGSSYRLVDNCQFSLTPVVELVGWSVLEGRKFAFNPNGPVDADGDNIVNLKIGARLARCGGRGDFYVGWGTALTDEAWYNDIARIDYRILF